jgi:hypothetical protein
MGENMERTVYDKKFNDNLVQGELFPEKQKIPEDFATFNDCPHQCIALGEGTSTISVRTPTGEKITFSFLRRGPDKSGHMCVDIVHHGPIKTDQGNAAQRVRLFTEGSTRIRTERSDEKAVTITTVMLD